MNNPDTFDYVALYAAIVSTIVALFEWYKHRTDRAYLRIEVSPNVDIFVNEEGKLITSGRATIQIFNDGRRACTIFEVGYVWKESVIAKLKRVVFGKVKMNIFRKGVVYSPIKNKDLPKKIDSEEIYQFEPTWHSFFLISYGTIIYFYAKDTSGRVAFTKKYPVNYFKDPYNENINEMPFEIDREGILVLNIPPDPKDWFTWGVRKPWWKRLFRNIL